MNRKISIAIPYYNRSSFIKETLLNIFEDSNVTEIVINDDCSPDEDFANLCNMVNDYNLKINKIKIYRNESNKGTFENKYIAVSKCTNDFLYLLDSDNYLLPNALESLFKIEWNKETSYNAEILNVSSSSEPWNHMRFCGDKLIKFEDILPIYIQDYGITGLLNSGNFFVNKENYLQVCKPYIDSFEPKKFYASDGIAFNYIWLSNNLNIQIVPGMGFFHRVHQDSSWGRSAHESTHINNILMELFSQNIKLNSDELIKKLS
jgi:glycosyltransferase involved in cell wall biosynthesis